MLKNALGIFFRVAEQQEKNNKCKQKMFNAFGTELYGENCRDHPLHSLLRLDLPHAACPLQLSL